MRRTLRILCPLLAPLGLASQAAAAEIVEVTPLTDQVLMVHLDDGYVKIHALGKPLADDEAVVTPLDASAAFKSSSWTLQSADDSDFASALSPTDVGRKSKGTEWSAKCGTWDASYGCINDFPDMAREHWVYLFLPKPMKLGKKYTLKSGLLATNGDSWDVTFDPNQHRSQAVHVNQIAYSTTAPQKFGYVYQWLGDRGGLELADYAGKQCRIVEEKTSKLVFTSKLTFRKDKKNVETFGQGTKDGNFAGADIYECDFSAFNTPGNYLLAVEGIGHSYPFYLHDDALRQPFYYAMKGIFLNRSGIAYDAKVSDGFARPAPHNPKLTPGFAGQLKYTSTRYEDVTSGDADEKDKPLWEAGLKGGIDTWGWYQDAGDWDAYPGHVRIPSMLLFLYEGFSSHFTDGELNIPESGNGIPDLLDEAAWLPRFYRRTRLAIQAAGWGTGGIAGARVFGDLWGGDNWKDAAGNEVSQASYTDTHRQWLVSGEDPWQTYRYAALAAQLAFNLDKLGKADPEGVDWKAEAISAWDWASKNTKPGDNAPTNKSSSPLGLERLYAAAALYRATGTASYHDTFKSEIATVEWSGGKPLAALAGKDRNLDANSRFVAFAYLSLAKSLNPDPTLVSAFTDAITNAAKFELQGVAERGARWGGNMYMPMVVGQGTTPLIENSVIGANLLKNQGSDLWKNSLAGFYTTADYFLGNNPLNTSWITRMGENPPKGIFRMDSFYNKEFPTPGFIPYGPWATSMGTFYPLGPWAGNWVLDKTQERTYPRITSVDKVLTNDWPGHEQWFELRTAPLTAENTIHQNNCPTAVLYGALTSETFSDWRQLETGPVPGGGGAGSGGAGSGANHGNGADANGAGANGAGANGAGSDASDSDASDSGCGCRIASSSRTTGAASLGLLLAAAALLRRRMRQ